VPELDEEDSESNIKEKGEDEDAIAKVKYE